MGQPRARLRHVSFARSDKEAMLEHGCYLWKLVRPLADSHKQERLQDHQQRLHLWSSSYEGSSPWASLSPLAMRPFAIFAFLYCSHHPSTRIIAAKSTLLFPPNVFLLLWLLTRILSWLLLIDSNVLVLQTTLHPTRLGRACTFLCLPLLMVPSRNTGHFGGRSPQAWLRYLVLPQCDLNQSSCLCIVGAEILRAWGCSSTRL